MKAARWSKGASASRRPVSETAQEYQDLNETPGQTFALWLSLALSCAFVSVLGWEMQGIQRMVDADSTRITPFILLLSLGCLAHGGWRAWRLSQEHTALSALLAGGAPQASTWSGLYCLALQDPQADRSSIDAVIDEQAHGPHELGWSMTGAMLKLALLGTVVGFVFMLGAINSLSVREFSDLPDMLARMGSGMGVALYTTVAGLIVNLLLSLQYLLLDRSADRFVARMHLSASQLRLVVDRIAA